jgi:hypothetical protein
VTNGLHAPRRPTRHPVPERRLWLPLLVAILLIAGGCGLGWARAQSLEDETFALTQAAAVWAPTATPAPTAEPTRYVPASRSGRLERAEVEAIAAEAFGPELAPKVASVVRCESTYDAGADGNWPYVGLLQVHPVIHQARLERVVGHPVTPDEARLLLTDPVLNLAVSALILRDQGWGAWPVCGRLNG